MKNFEKLFNLREWQNQNKDNDDEATKKKMEETNKQTEELMKKRGVEQVVLEHAHIENIVRNLKLKYNEENLEEELHDDSRYVHLLVEQEVGGKWEKRFLKIFRDMKDKEERNHHGNAFIREIRTNQLLNKTKIPSLRVYDTNIGDEPIDPENNNPENKTLYALFETLPENDQIGFIKEREDIQKLGGEHAVRTINQLLTLQKEITDAGLSDNLEKEIHDAQDPMGYYDGYIENTKKILSLFEFEEECDEKYENYVTPADVEEIKQYMADKHPEEYKELEKDIEEDKVDENRLPFWVVTEYRLSKQGFETDFKDSVGKLFDRFKTTMSKYDQNGKYLVHGDLSPNNIYVDGNNDVQFLDWEWAGITENELLAVIYDYGNMRARAWNNKDFRIALDKAIIDHFRENGDEEAGKSIVSLGILRSHCNLAGFFENYDIEKQREKEEKERRESTEEDIALAFNIDEYVEKIK